MNKLCIVCFVFCVSLLSGCHSGVNFEFATTQDNTQCLQENPSQNCDIMKNKQ